MVEKIEFFIPSTNGHNRLHTIMWKSDCPTLAILQISHGMIEHIERYDDFANYLAEKGILVVGNDHLGHGKSVTSHDEFGYFNASDSSKTVVDDLHQLTTLIKSKYPGIPYFLLGHSMGSFMARRYIMTYGNELDGAIIMGTGQQPALALKAGKLLVHLISLFKPMTYRSKLIEQACFGTYNNRFKPRRTKSDWLSQDTAVVDAYIQDPFCDFTFTLNGYLTLFNTLSFIRRTQNIKQIPKSLPIFMVAGKEDPVGNFGKMVRKVYNHYKKIGIQDISLKLYENDRHELLNELDKKQVYADLYTWLKKHISS
ncbi:MAG: lysophospholipase [Candidatus Cellulosilyticum pullistercoris]|uniref:Lysophospholipase n=1 Tax=Candidatus Cellulosilyticum pullistercoris TaxID=2838521 RepID=A0A9E2KBK0_9FIRM|nr:lysophospholipase [Candidatus Cellulosilyticum pullistercoris]